MKNYKVFKLSLITAACIAASAPVFAGKIIGVQQGAPSPYFASSADDYKSGFGGWNLGNVDVKIFDIAGNDATKLFYPSDGSYTPMVLGDSFKSYIYNQPVDGIADSVEPVGILGGKDWPKGEPSGVKVITTDTIENQTNNRPNSCIMSTSYHPYSDEIEWVDGFTLPQGATAEDGVLGSGYINPTLCDSPFQTHKRFKVSAQPASLDNGGIDIVLNLDTDNTETDIRRYTVLQKLNNYTGSRLTGFRIELGFGVGNDFTPIDTTDTTATDELIDHLRLSLGTGEKTIVDEDGKVKTITDFWRPEDWAKFSAGLFSLADAPHHPNNGFFSAAPKGVGYVAALTDAGTIESTSEISPEYKALFGDWLPSTMAPKGVFYDDDLDPTTDNELVAFWGDDPATTEVDFKWLSGNENDFAPITNDQLYSWKNNTGMPDGSNQYQIDVIEDVLNLGLNYMVEVGNVATINTLNPLNANTLYAGTFTIRMVPITTADVDSSDPGWITDPAVPLADALPADYVPPVDDTVDDTVGDEPADDTTTSSSGSSASALGNTGAIAAILAFLGLGGWLARRKLAK